MADQTPGDLQEMSASASPGPITVLYSFPFRLGVTGIGTTAARQVQGLIERGHRVHVVAGSAEPGAAAGAASVTQTMAVRGTRIPHRALGGDRALLWHDRLAARAVRRLRPDVVHTWPLGSVATLEEAASCGVPSCREVPNTHTGNAYEVAARVHEQLGLAPEKGYSHSPNSWRLAREEREYASARVLLVPSEHVRQTFLDRGYPATKLVRHRYGFDPDRFPVPAAPPSREPFTVVFVGRGEPRKGLHLALDAFFASSAHRGGRLLVCGEIQPAYRELLGERLRRPEVVVLGSRSDVPDIMARAHVFVLPSLEEGSALVTYEAAGVGCVRAVSDATGADCRHDVDALVHPAGDVATLSAHLSRLADDHETWTRLRQATLARRSELTWAAAAVAVEAAYRQVLRRQP